MKRNFYLEAGTTITAVAPSFFTDVRERLVWTESTEEVIDHLSLTQGLSLYEDCLLAEEDEIWVFSVPAIPVFMVSKEDVKIVTYDPSSGYGDIIPITSFHKD